MSFVDIILSEDKRSIQRLLISVESSLTDLFTSMFNAQISFAPYQLLETSDSSYDYSGIVSIVEGSVQGLMVLSFRKDYLFELLEGFYKKKFVTATEEVNQSIAEMTNIVFGNFKSEAAKMGFSFKEIIPSVISGVSSHESLFFGEYKILNLPCIYKNDGMAFNIIIKKS